MVLASAVLFNQDALFPILFFGAKEIGDRRRERFQVGNILLQPVGSEVAVRNKFFEVEHHAKIACLSR
jgi:hypothetical protein